MSFFRNKKVFTTTKIVIKNSIGQEEEKYRKNNEYILADVQPIDQKAIKYNWGEEIKATKQMYCNDEFLIDDVVFYKDKAYKIVSAIEWNSYNLYALQEEFVDEDS